MGNYVRNVGIFIKVRENLTDPKFVEFIQDWDFTEDEISTFLESIWEKSRNENSSKIVKFFIEYKDGILHPDKCDIVCPTKKPFDERGYTLSVAWLSYPGARLILEKKYKYKAVLECKYWGALTSGGEILNPKKIFPRYMGIVTSTCITSKEQITRPLPEYMGFITIWFGKYRKINIEFLVQLLEDFCMYLNTDYGVLFDQETHEVLFDLFEKEK